jgi:hypothetical protein
MAHEVKQIGIMATRKHYTLTGFAIALNIQRAPHAGKQTGALFPPSISKRYSALTV